MAGVTDNLIKLAGDVSGEPTRANWTFCSRPENAQPAP